MTADMEWKGQTMEVKLSVEYRVALTYSLILLVTSLSLSVRARLNQGDFHSFGSLPEKSRGAFNLIALSSENSEQPSDPNVPSSTLGYLYHDLSMTPTYELWSRGMSICHPTSDSPPTAVYRNLDI
jgi:hypothetical protein